MNITNQIYVGAEAAMSNALAGVSRPNGVKRLFIVLCAPLLLVVFVLRTTLRVLKDERVIVKYRHHAAACDDECQCDCPG